MHTVDFMETYSPTPEALCVKTVVAVAVERDWELRQLDVKQAFIQADLDYDVYMKLPDGCGDKSGEIVKLKKSSLLPQTSWTPVVVKTYPSAR